LYGAYKVTRAAWPYMRDQKYGRIVMTSSGAGVYGNFGQANYSSAKLALVGFSNSLAKEGAKLNIHCNAIAPVAGSRMTETVMPPDMVRALKPEYISPVVAYLCHDSCAANGELFELGAGWVSKVRWQRSRGYFHPLTQPFAIEDVAHNFAQVTDFTDATTPSSPQDAFSPIMENLKQAEGKEIAPIAMASKPQKPKATAAPAASSNKSGFKAAAVFNQLSALLKADPSVVSKVQAIFVYQLKRGKDTATWTIDLKNGAGRIYSGEPPNPKDADATFTLDDDDFVAMIEQKANPQNLFMSGKLKLKGNLAKAMNFEKVIKGLAPKAKL